MKTSQSQNSIPEAQVKAGMEPRTLTLLELTLPCSRCCLQPSPASGREIWTLISKSHSGLPELLSTKPCLYITESGDNTTGALQLLKDL